MPLLDDEYLISTRAEWAAISSPVRFQMIEFMRMVAPCSLAELGRAMGRPADGLYHHARLLSRAGLIVRAVPVDASADPRAEAVYRLPATKIRFDANPAAGRSAAPIRKMMAGLCRMTDRGLAHVIDAGIPVGDGSAKQVWARAETAWLTEAALAEVNEHFAAIDAIFERGRRVRAGRLFQCSLFLYPVVRAARKSDAARTSDAPRNVAAPRNGVAPRSGAAPRKRNAAKPKSSSKKGARTWSIPQA